MPCAPTRAKAQSSTTASSVRSASSLNGGALASPSCAVQALMPGMAIPGAMGHGPIAHCRHWVYLQTCPLKPNPTSGSRATPPSGPSTPHGCPCRHCPRWPPPPCKRPARQTGPRPGLRQGGHTPIAERWPGGSLAPALLGETAARNSRNSRKWDHSGPGCNVGVAENPCPPWPRGGTRAPPREEPAERAMALRRGGGGG